MKAALFRTPLRLSVLGLLGTLLLLQRPAPWIYSLSFFALAFESNPALRLLGLALGALVNLFFIGLALWAARKVARWDKGTPGRRRRRLFFLLAALQLSAQSATLSLLAAPAKSLPQPLPGFFPSALADWPAALRPLLGTTLALDGLFWLLAITTLLSCWSLLSQAFRARFWAFADALLLIAAALVFFYFRLPAKPLADDPTSLAQSSLRLVLTCVFVLRAFLRALPSLMNAIERVGFRAFVAARHLRSRKSGFLATIGLLSILAVSFSSCALSTTLSVMGGFRNDLKGKILGNHAHIVIDRDGTPFTSWVPPLETVRRHPEIVGAGPFLSGEVMITSASNLAGAVLRGIEARRVGEVSDLPRNLKEGKLRYLLHPEELHARQAIDIPPRNPSAKAALEPGPSVLRSRPGELPSEAALGEEAAALGEEKLPAIIVGQELARSLRLEVGDEVNVVSPFGDIGPSGPIPKSKPFRVGGIFYSGMYEYDMKYAYVELAVAQRFLAFPQAVSGIEIKVDRPENAPTIARDLRKKLRNSKLRVQDWQQLNSNLFGALALEKLAMFITLGIAVLVAGFCVFGTLTLMVQEKGREVAILKAMGTPNRGIVGVFLLEGAFIGLLGAALGLGLGFVVCFAAEHFGIKMNPEVYYIDKLPVHIDPFEFWLVGVASLAVCLIATVFPALLASRTTPVEALRYE